MQRTEADQRLTIWSREYRALTPEQRREIRGAVRGGRAVGDPALAMYAVRFAATERKTINLLPLFFAALVAWRVSYLGRAGGKPLIGVYVGCIAIALAAQFLIWRPRAIRAERLNRDLLQAHPTSPDSPPS